MPRAAPGRSQNPGAPSRSPKHQSHLPSTSFPGSLEEAGSEVDGTGTAGAQTGTLIGDSGRASKPPQGPLVLRSPCRPCSVDGSCQGRITPPPQHLAELIMSPSHLLLGPRALPWELLSLCAPVSGPAPLSLNHAQMATLIQHTQLQYPTGTCSFTFHPVPAPTPQESPTAPLEGAIQTPGQW